MTDQAEVRRDAERFTNLDDARLIHLEDAERIVSVMAALLAELKQAERVAESVPALVEALRQWCEWYEAGKRPAGTIARQQKWMQDEKLLGDALVAALTVYEQSQGNAE